MHYITPNTILVLFAPTSSTPNALTLFSPATKTSKAMLALSVGQQSKFIVLTMAVNSPLKNSITTSQKRVFNDNSVCAIPQHKTEWLNGLIAPSWSEHVLSLLRPDCL